MLFLLFHGYNRFTTVGVNGLGLVVIDHDTTIGGDTTVEFNGF
jgi:hypothetical protein